MQAILDRRSRAVVSFVNVKVHRTKLSPLSYSLQRLSPCLFVKDPAGFVVAGRVTGRRRTFQFHFDLALRTIDLPSCPSVPQYRNKQRRGARDRGGRSPNACQLENRQQLQLRLVLNDEASGPAASECDDDMLVLSNAIAVARSPAPVKGVRLLVRPLKLQKSASSHSKSRLESPWHAWTWIPPTAMCLRGFISIMIRTFINIH